MRGIEFVTDIGYSDVLNEIFTGISLTEYDFYISQNELFSDSNLPAISPKMDVDFFEKLKTCTPYYVFFFNLQAYRKGEMQQKIRNYDEFLKSNCQFIVLITDGRYFDIYVKDERLLLQFIKNAINLDGKDIRIKTNYDDGRTRMSVW